MHAAEKIPEDGRDSSNGIQNRDFARRSVVSLHAEIEGRGFFFR